MRTVWGPACFGMLLCTATDLFAQTSKDEVIYATPIIDPDRLRPPLEEQEKKAGAEEKARTDELARQGAELADRVDALEKEVRRLNYGDVDHLFGIGSGMLIQGDGTPAFMVEGSLRYLFACYSPARATCLGFVSTIDVRRVQVHPIGAGLTFYDDRHRPFSVSRIPRGWDFLLTTGADVNIWEGFGLRIQLAWFLPNPSDVTKYVSRKMDADLERYREEMRRISKDVGDAEKPDDLRDSRTDAGDATTDIGNRLEDDANQFGAAYRKAFRSPRVFLGLRWEF